MLSDAYWFDSRRDEREPDDTVLPKVRAENDWTAAQVAQFPDRLVAFCSFNPLREYALAELNRCAKSGSFRGLKLHFNTSGVNLHNAGPRCSELQIACARSGCRASSTIPSGRRPKPRRLATRERSFVVRYR